METVGCLVLQVLKRQEAEKGKEETQNSRQRRPGEEEERSCLYGSRLKKLVRGIIGKE